MCEQKGLDLCVEGGVVFEQQVVGLGGPDVEQRGLQDNDFQLCGAGEVHLQSGSCKIRV